MIINNILNKNKSNQETENILYSAPFYGEKGSICKIIKDGDYYKVTRYGINGEEGEVLITPKKRRKKLINNYMEDITNYLQKESEKYLTVKSKEPKKELSKKRIIIVSSISVILTIVSGLGMIFTTETIMSACIPTFVISFIVSCGELNELKKYLTNEKNKKFRKTYENYKKEINEYNITKDIEQKEKTKYTSINQNKQNKVIGENKILKKEKM